MSTNSSLNIMQRRYMMHNLRTRFAYLNVADNQLSGSRVQFMNETKSFSSMNRDHLYDKPWAAVADFSILASEGGDKKPPKGFEKFFRGKKASSSNDESAKEDKKEDKEKANKEKDEELSEEEDAHETASKEKEPEDNRNQFMKALFTPENDPKPEGWLGILLALATGYFVLNYKKPMKEVVYMQFLNDYLLKNQIKEISITKDKRSEVFNFRAEFQTHDGEKYYMTLNSYESFLAKLDMVQKEMGKQAHEYIPVKYTSSDEQTVGANAVNILIGLLFLTFVW